MEECGQGWERNGNNCYLWSTEKKTWADAEHFCQGEGGHLASVPSSAIEDYVKEGLQRHNIDVAWLGGNDIEEEGTWKWADCTPWDYTFWAPREPKNWGGHEDCLQQHGDTHTELPLAWKWNDKNCNDKFKFLCSKRIC